uniref:Asp_Arg_Hydrox domain-containing protein n=1 Tax=Haemonchus contortus TaxID=6289 RepID=A0A7I4Z5S7_HAECO
MASKQNGNSIAAPRPPFRRQGSSIGAGPHPMAVALAPVHRIDYSVTKGGARTWAVLLVFLFLCSGLYTIFSSKDLPEGVDNFTGVQKDRQKEVGNDDSYQDVSSESFGPGENDESAEEPTERIADDDDDSEEGQPLEHQLFAGLRRKIENNIKRVREYVEVQEREIVHEARDDDDNREPQLPLKRTKRKKQKEVRVKMEPTPQRHKSHGKRRAMEEQPEDVRNEDEDLESDEEDEELKNGLFETERPDESDAEPPSEDQEDHEEEEDGADTDSPQHHRRTKTHGFRHLMAESAPERECRRKHCPPSYGAEPRISLLKKKTKGSTAEIEEHDENNSAENDENEDSEDGDEDNELMPPPQVKQAEVALTKQRAGGREAYRRQAITNRDDHKSRDALDRADNLVEKVTIKRSKKNRKRDEF